MIDVAKPLSEVLGRAARPKRLAVGIELEFERFDMGRYMESSVSVTQDTYRVTGDGSLRNMGAEIVSRPLELPSVPRFIKQFSALKKAMPSIEAHKRCGTHIHVNFSHSNIGHLAAFVAGYLLIEPALFENVAPERKNNAFCIPLHQCELEVDENIRKAIYYPMKAAHLLSQIQKYTAMNLAALTTFGTAEWRMFPGTKSITTLKSWIDLVVTASNSSKLFQYYPHEIFDMYEDLGLAEFYELMTGQSMKIEPDPSAQRQAEFSALTIICET